MKHLIVLAIAGLLAFHTPAAFAEDNDNIHLTEGQVSLPWSVKDGSGMNWDIQPTGVVQTGGGAYAGFMNLLVNSNQFSFGGVCKIDADNREIEIGPWNWNNVTISRRIYVDPKEGYCRWIDIFENSSDQDQSLQIQYNNNLSQPIKDAQGPTGKPFDPKKDYACLTVPNNDQPLTVHFFGSRGIKSIPQADFPKSKNNSNYKYTLNLPAGKAAALCFFESQHTSLDKAKAFIKNFDPQLELAKAPEALRKIVVNIGAPRSALEGIDMPRHNQFDLLVTDKDKELTGTIQGDRFVMETIFGKLDLPAQKVIGMIAAPDEQPFVQVVLVDGQIIAGRMTNGPLIFKLSAGGEMTLTPQTLKSVSYRISAAKPQDVMTLNSFVVLPTGQRFLFGADQAVWDFNSPYGNFRLTPAQLATVHFTTPEGGLHRAVFRNGSVISGLLAADKLSLKLDLGIALESTPGRLGRIEFSADPVDPRGLTQATLVNDDVLVGKLVDETLEVVTAGGTIPLKQGDISTVEFLEDSMGQVEIVLKNKTQVVGTLKAQSLTFKIEPGPELKVFVGLLQSIAFSAPAPAVPATPAAPAAPVAKPAEPGLQIQIMPAVRPAKVNQAIVAPQKE